MGKRSAICVYWGDNAQVYIVSLSLSLSCVECLDTAGACGWCVYGQQCSGVPEPCPVLAEVNSSYLTVSPLYPLSDTE